MEADAEVQMRWRATYPKAGLEWRSGPQLGVRRSGLELSIVCPVRLEKCHCDHSGWRFAGNVLPIISRRIKVTYGTL